MYVFSVALHPGCAADHGYAPAPATLGFGVQPLRGKESDRSTSDDGLDVESITALGGDYSRSVLAPSPAGTLVEWYAIRLVAS